MFLGCIGDDFTGSSDLANTLAKAGMRVVQFNGVPRNAAGEMAQAGVVALKSRSAPASEAVAQSLAALNWLKAQGCRQFLFKYCSTFDSTPEGNIGPVLDALANALGAPRAVVCPVFPATGRTLYQGHLFVGDRLLNESGMENHPLTPIRDADIRRWLSHQTRHSVGHVPYADVAGGTAMIRAALDRETQAGRPYIVVDAIHDGDLLEIGRALADDVLISGGSGIALGLPENFRNKGLLKPGETSWQGVEGPVAALCGSCSITSRCQIETHAKNHPTCEIAAKDVLAAKIAPAEIRDWAIANQQGGRIPLAFSSADPAEVARVQEAHGKERTAHAIEEFFSKLARLLIDAGIVRLISAGGETSGAVVSGLEIAAFEIGPEIDPGVPALRVAGSDVVLALKSGNFGAADFFEKAAGVLAGKAST